MKTQNEEKLSLLDFMRKQNSILRFHTKPTEFTQKRTEIEKNFHCAVGGNRWKPDGLLSRKSRFIHTTYRKNNNLEKCAGMGLNGFQIR